MHFLGNGGFQTRKHFEHWRWKFESVKLSKDVSFILYHIRTIPQQWLSDYNN